MTRIDFYTLVEPAPDAALRLACQLVEQAYAEGRRVHVHAGSERLAHAIDELLWTYEPASFLPHNLVGEGPYPVPPIQIGWGEAQARNTDLLINLADEVPTALFGRFAQVAEFVPVAEDAKAKARERYRFYRDRGYPLRMIQEPSATPPVSPEPAPNERAPS